MIAELVVQYHTDPRVVVVIGPAPISTLKGISASAAAWCHCRPSKLMLGAHKNANFVLGAEAEIDKLRGAK